eukprot:jgi/Phyca11/5248/fgenesh1_pm.PHYCAscaffold_5_\
MLMLELHALRAELQSTLDRLGVDTAGSDDDTSSTNLLERPTAPETTETQLQQQREDIMRQMQQDTAADAAEREQVEAVQVSQQVYENSNLGPSPPLAENNESAAQYSIGGVVTLEPLSSSQRLQLSGSTSLLRPVAAAPAPAQVPTTLKFAETMLKLEKSVQMRDKLLHHGVTTLPKQRNREERRQVHYRGGRRRRAESGSNSDTSATEAVDGLKSTESPKATRKTPTSGSSVTTPTTGSDQKSNTSLSKQVRFGDDAYSTPVLARKFNFDGPSIDEDDYEEKDEEVAESVLSFLDGSSVTSAELNDASFLRAFDQFRRELNVSRQSFVVQSPHFQSLMV